MILKMNNIHKTFNSNKVLSGIDFEVKEGEVHALMGENGAGKSTLMNILGGVKKQDTGQIIFDGRVIEVLNPKKAESLGIIFIHQELNIWPNLSVLENLFIGKEKTNPLGFLDHKEMEKLALSKCNELGVSLPLEQKAIACSISQQQIIEIIRALLNTPKIIIMDEPTAALTNIETDKLFLLIKNMIKNKVSVIYISHRIEEIFTISDRISVMRDGLMVFSKNKNETTISQVIKEMVGKSLNEQFPKRNYVRGKEIFEIKNFTSNKFKNISFKLYEGEILGIAGMMGSGRTEIMRAIFGLDKIQTGEIIFKGASIKITNPVDAIKNNIAFVTENRKDEGVFLDFSIKDNLSLPYIDNITSVNFINNTKELSYVEHILKNLKMKFSSIYSFVGNLSGGNQQKVVIAKWIGLNPKILLLDEPTRGIDIGAKNEIYNLINELTKNNVSIIIVSSDLYEILGISDRIMVISEGCKTGELTQNEATQESILNLATRNKL